MGFLRCLCTLLAITYVRGSGVPEHFVDQGRNLSLPCSIKHKDGIMWVREGRGEKQFERLSVDPNGSLFLMKVNRNDSGIYSCSIDSSDSDNNIKSKVKVRVRTPPPALANVTVRPSTILALLIWEVKENGGYPILDFTAQYKVANDSEWIPISPNHITPNARQLEIYKLEPNTTYSFRIWATNQLGAGDVTELDAKTLKSYEEIELARHFLVGAEKFDTRVWLVAVGIVMGTLTVLGFGTCYLLYQEYRVPDVETSDEQEIIELVPNIILNPGFEDNGHTERIPADENSNNETTTRLNNNTVVQPRHV